MNSNADYAEVREDPAIKIQEQRIADCLDKLRDLKEKKKVASDMVKDYLNNDT